MNFKDRRQDLNIFNQGDVLITKSKNNIETQYLIVGKDLSIDNTYTLISLSSSSLSDIEFEQGFNPIKELSELIKEKLDENLVDIIPTEQIMIRATGRRNKIGLDESK